MIGPNQDNNKISSMNQNQIISDEQYFNKLTHYKPLFYSGKGTPIFMTNTSWYQSFGCLACMDVLGILIFVLFILNAQKNEQKLQQQHISMFWIIFAFICIFISANICFFLTQLLNPGILNISAVATPSASNLIFCKFCNFVVSKQMTHCKQCQVCIWGLDHHCGFFNKCIGGYQKWAFFGTLTFGFLAFVSLIMLAACTLI